MKTSFPLLTFCIVLCTAACAAARIEAPVHLDQAEEILRAEASLDAFHECDIWLFNSRNLPCPRNVCEPIGEPKIYRRQECDWVSSTPESFYATANPQQITCVYIHGNRISTSDACRRGVKLYRRLGGNSHGIRFVIWSWNSGEVKGRIRDARVKAARADRESFHLACFLSRLPDASQVSLIGYSFGARIAAGSIHILAGGQFCGNSLPADRLPNYRPRAILMAGALSHGWIRPGGTLGLVTTKVDHLYSTVNRLDPALKRFHVTSKKNRPKALGYTGISKNSLGPNSHVVTQHDVSGWVGWTHRFDRHIESGPLMGQVRRFALWTPVN